MNNDLIRKKIMEKISAWRTRLHQEFSAKRSFYNIGELGKEFDLYVDEYRKHVLKDRFKEEREYEKW
jgi:hypothetical protein